ncbi:MAG: beta-lactamase family protein [Bacteroidales bacterium]|nr:beta-lactamase family protein [Bacteroidales bacterium]
MKKLILSALTVALVGCSTAPQGLKMANPAECGMDPERLALCDSAINACIANSDFPGAVLSIVRGDKIVYLKAYGYKQVVPDTLAMPVDGIFDLASVSKTVGTTLSFLQLVEDGQVRLQDNVNKYIPEFQPWVDPETGEKVNIEICDLLTHSSGLDAYANANDMVALYGENQPDSLMHYIATRSGRNFRPKTDFRYSCLNFITLQNILQKVTGMTLAEYAQKNVFDVLGLKNTCYMPSEDMYPRCIPTEIQPDGKPLVGKVHDPLARLMNGGNSGNAGVFSTAEDLSVIAAAIMNGGAINGKRILSPLTVKTMSTVPSNIDPKIGRGLGFDINSDYSSNKGNLFGDEGVICHTGYTGTSWVMDLKTKTAVILLTNRAHPYDGGAAVPIRTKIANIVASAIME